MANKSYLHLSFQKRREFSKEGKQKIARKALEFIQQGDFIFLSAGTTISFLGEELAKSKHHFMLKIWTNNLALVDMWLRRYENMFNKNFMGVIGGEISRRNLSIINLSLPFHSLPKAFIGTPGISTRGMSADDIYTVKQMDSLIKKVERVFILADRSKVGRDCTYITRTMRMIKLDLKKGKKYCLITNASKKSEGYVEEELRKMRNYGIEVIEVK